MNNWKTNKIRTVWIKGWPFIHPRLINLIQLRLGIKSHVRPSNKAYTWSAFRAVKHRECSRSSVQIYRPLCLQTNCVGFSSYATIAYCSRCEISKCLCWFTKSNLFIVWECRKSWVKFCFFSIDCVKTIGQLKSKILDQFMQPDWACCKLNINVSNPWYACELYRVPSVYLCEGYFLYHAHYAVSLDE